ncbi:MAG: hypothetical protein POELPBGB_00797 [Bacteroidia bacterium]|nr:hypothetical protein [Bacteroidia bacterium]
MSIISDTEYKKRFKTGIKNLIKGVTNELKIKSRDSITAKLIAFNHNTLRHSESLMKFKDANNVEQFDQFIDKLIKEFQFREKYFAPDHCKNFFEGSIDKIKNEFVDRRDLHYNKDLVKADSETLFLLLIEILSYRQLHRSMEGTNHLKSITIKELRNLIFKNLVYDNNEPVFKPKHQKMDGVDGEYEIPIPFKLKKKNIKNNLAKELSIKLPSVKRDAEDKITSLNLNQTAWLVKCLMKEKIVLNSKNYQPKTEISKAIQVLTGYGSEKIRQILSSNTGEITSKDLNELKAKIKNLLTTLDTIAKDKVTAK